MMVNKFKYKKLTWIDLESPTEMELRKVMEEYKINTPIAEELRAPTEKPKVDLYKNVIYLILHFPAFKHSHISQSNQEVDFIIGKNFLITVHYDPIDPIHKFSKEFEVNAILNKGNLGTHAGHIFAQLITKLYGSLEHELEFIASNLDIVEDKIFGGKEKEVVRDISQISRDLLNFRQATSSHGDVLDSFELAGKSFFGKDFEHQLRAIVGEYYKIHRLIENHRESLMELRDTNNSLLNTKQNEVMKVLTIMAFVTFPLSLLASIFGMNTDYLPIVGRNGDFWIIMGMMAVLTTTFFAVFKYKKWL